MDPQRAALGPLLALVTIVIGLLAPGAMAASAAERAASVPAKSLGSGGPAWSDLSRAQREALAPLEAHWTAIDRNRRDKWLEVAARFPSMPAAERERVQERMAPWAALTPGERGQARLKFQEARQLSPDDRPARWEAYQSLPEDERRDWAHRVPPTASAASSSDLKAGLAGASANKKSNIIHAPATPVARAVSPTVILVRPGATTTLISTPANPPLHHQPGLPKIAATEGFVNPLTLLPKRGSQGAAVQPAHPRDANGS